MSLHVCCRAQKLIAGLGGEKSRWTAAAERLGKEYTQLTGDVLLAAAQIAYLGAFTSTYRTECLRGWAKACTAKGVPCSEKFKLAAVLGDPVKVCVQALQLIGRASWDARRFDMPLPRLCYQPARLSLLHAGTR